HLIDCFLVAFFFRLSTWSMVIGFVSFRQSSQESCGGGVWGGFASPSYSISRPTGRLRRPVGRETQSLEGLRPSKPPGWAAKELALNIPLIGVFGDGNLLDLRAALDDLHDLGVAHVALDRARGAAAASAVDLHSVAGGFHRTGGGEVFRDQ